MTFNFPILYHEEKARKWKIWVDDGCIYKTDGLTKKDFTKEPSCRKVEAKGKNTVDEQAIQNARRDFVKKLDDGYRPSSDDKVGLKMVEEILENKKKQGGNNHGVFTSGNEDKGKLKNTESSSVITEKYEAMLAQKYDEKTKLVLWTDAQKKEVEDKLTKIESKKNKNISLEELAKVVKNRLNTEYVDVSCGALLQCKIDGVRSLSFIDAVSKDLVCLSRGSKQWLHLSEQKKELKKFLEKNPNIVLDGEFYVHEPTVDGVKLKGNDTFRFITTCCKTVMTKPNINEGLIEYHVFDIIIKDDPNASQTKRFKVLREMFKNYKNPLKYLRLVPLQFVKNEEEMMKWQHKFYVEQGYEGVMLRNPKGRYMQDKRSIHLLKFKEFEDEEFIITGAEKGFGTKDGVVVWVCEANDGSGNTFKCSMKCSVEEGREYYDSYADYLGQKLKVKYQGKSSSGIPRFPVGIAIREEGT